LTRIKPRLQRQIQRDVSTRPDLKIKSKGNVEIMEVIDLTALDEVPYPEPEPEPPSKRPKRKRKT